MMMGLGSLGMFLLWGFLLALGAAGIALVVWLATGGGISSGQTRPRARQVLDERFARGAMDREEYEAGRAQSEG